MNWFVIVWPGVIVSEVGPIGSIIYITGRPLCKIW